MYPLSISSVFEISDWFFRRTDQDDKYLDNIKLQQLLFLAQIHYYIKNQSCLFPGTFVYSQGQISEPNLTKILEFGMPLMPTPKFDNEISKFLEVIWQKYSPIDVKELDQTINSYLSAYDTIISIEEYAQNFKSQLNKKTPTENKKVLISQNGPVVVSQWKPRKLSSNQNKESNNV